MDVLCALGDTASADDIRKRLSDPPSGEVAAARSRTSGPRTLDIRRSHAPGPRAGAPGCGCRRRGRSAKRRLVHLLSGSRPAPLFFRVTPSHVPDGPVGCFTSGSHKAVLGQHANRRLERGIRRRTHYDDSGIPKRGSHESVHRFGRVPAALVFGRYGVADLDPSFRRRWPGVARNAHKTTAFSRGSGTCQYVVQSPRADRGVSLELRANPRNVSRLEYRRRPGGGYARPKAGLQRGPSACLSFAELYRRRYQLQPLGLHELRCLPDAQLVVARSITAPITVTIPRPRLFVMHDEAEALYKALAGVLQR